MYIHGRLQIYTMQLQVQYNILLTQYTHEQDKWLEHNNNNNTL